MGQFVDLMLDIETTGLKPGCGVWNIGIAVNGLEGCEEATFVCTINPESLDTVEGITADFRTILWQQMSNDENWTVAHSYEKSPDALRTMLEDTAEYLQRVRSAASNEGKKLRLWCKGTNFDFPIMEYLYKLFELPVPWYYNELHDLRTVLSICNVRATKGPNSHDALADAETQLEDLLVCLGKISLSVV